MKRTVFFCFICLATGVALLYLASCSKTGNTPPGIMFNSTPSSPYPDTVLVYHNTTLAQGAHFFVSLTVSKAGEDVTLDTAIFSRSVNGGPDSVFQHFSLLSSYFYGQYFFVAGDSGNVEKYTFTFGQINGVFSSDSLIIKDSI